MPIDGYFDVTIPLHRMINLHDKSLWHMQQAFPASTGFLAKLLPFFGAGVLIVLAILSFVLVSYVLFLGCVIGAILFIIAWVKNQFFPKKYVNNPIQQGRIYEHDDN